MDTTAFFNMTYGMYVITAQDGDSKGGQICNTAFQITAEPPKFAISINKLNNTFDLIKSSRKFNMSVLSTGATFEEVGFFGFKSGRDIDKTAKYEMGVGTNGVPYLKENAVCYYECDVFNEFDFGTHVVFAGNVVNAENLEKGDVMTYEYYHKVLKGKSPKTAPTFVSK